MVPLAVGVAVGAFAVLACCTVAFFAILFRRKRAAEAAADAQAKYKTTAAGVTGQGGSPNGKHSAGAGGNGTGNGNGNRAGHAAAGDVVLQVDLTSLSRGADGEVPAAGSPTRGAAGGAGGHSPGSPHGSLTPGGGGGSQGPDTTSEGRWEADTPASNTDASASGSLSVSPGFGGRSSRFPPPPRAALSASSAESRGGGGGAIPKLVLSMRGLSATDAASDPLRPRLRSGGSVPTGMSDLGAAEPIAEAPAGSSEDAAGGARAERDSDGLGGNGAVNPRGGKEHPAVLPVGYRIDPTAVRRGQLVRF